MRDDRERLADVLAAIFRNSRNLSPGSLPSLTRKQKTPGERPSRSALADGDIAFVDLTTTDYADGRPGEYIQDQPGSPGMQLVLSCAFPATRCPGAGTRRQDVLCGRRRRASAWLTPGSQSAGT